MNNANTPLITNATMNTTLTSQAIVLVDIFGYAVEAIYTGTPNGTLKLQASAAPFKQGGQITQPQVPPSGSWVDIANSPVTVTSSGSYIWNVRDTMYTFVRLVYTDASGGTSTAVLNANINIKGP